MPLTTHDRALLEGRLNVLDLEECPLVVDESMAELVWADNARKHDDCDRWESEHQDWWFWTPAQDLGSPK